MRRILKLLKNLTPVFILLGICAAMYHDPWLLHHNWKKYVYRPNHNGTFLDQPITVTFLDETDLHHIRDGHIAIWTSCCTVFTGGIHDAWSLIQHFNAHNWPHLIIANDLSSMNLHHYLLGRICSESTSLSLTLYTYMHALSCKENIQIQTLYRLWVTWNFAFRLQKIKNPNKKTKHKKLTSQINNT